MDFIATRIITDDVEGLLSFYEKVTGLEGNRRHPLFVELRTPAGTLAISSTETIPAMGAGVAEARANRSVIIDFRVDDVDAEYTRLRDLIDTVETEPSDMPWGNRSLLFRDPDGNLVNFFAPITAEAAERSAR
jgi:catechol 2,3-dioxygenase-like lactoylglutathione lyase family enzyme